MSAPLTPDVPPLVAPPPHPMLSLPVELRPAVQNLVTEDDTPVDNIYSEKQQRLLTGPLYASWQPPARRPFLVLANVGMFYAIRQPPLVPDVLFSLDVTLPDNLMLKEHRSYFFWEYGKPPDIAIEVVSNNEGNELGSKRDKYAEIGIPFYVVWDPARILGQTRLHVLGNKLKKYEPMDRAWFADANLGLTVWHGKFEGCEVDWLRWCDAHGTVIPTGEERANQEREETNRAQKRAEDASTRADAAEERERRLADTLRELGVDPGVLK